MANRFLRYALGARRPGFLLAGHGVATSFRDRQVEEVHIALRDFVEIIDLLTELGFEFVDLSCLKHIQANGWKFSKPWVHLSFDDGYKNNLTVVRPLLAEKGIPFTVFVSSHHIESGDRFPTFWLRFAEWNKLSFTAIFPDAGFEAGIGSAAVFERLFRDTAIADFERNLTTLKAAVSSYVATELGKFTNDQPMSIAEVERLATFPGVDIGSHSRRHLTFRDGLEPEVGREELAASLRFVKAVQAAPILSFCYPNGDWTPAWREEVRNAGYLFAFASTSGFIDAKSDPFALPRFWLSNARRIKAICVLSLIGNVALRAIGR